MRLLPRKGLARDEDGTVLIETLIAMPVLMIMTFGILEFGNMMWQRQQLQIGVRDAARYWSKCRPTFHSCTLANAQNIAFYGDPRGAANSALRVPGWDDSSELTITPASPPTEPDENDLVIVSAKFVYQGTPVYDAIFGGTTEIGYNYTTRYFGW